MSGKLPPWWICGEVIFSWMFSFYKGLLYWATVFNGFKYFYLSDLSTFRVGGEGVQFSEDSLAFPEFEKNSCPYITETTGLILKVCVSKFFWGGGKENGMILEKKLRSLEKKFTFPGKNIYSPWKRNLGSFGRVVLWSSGPVVLWSCGPLVLWPSGPVVLVLWSSGPVVLVLWSCSALALWSRGPLAKAWKEICRDQKCLEGMQKEVRLRKTKKRDN